jgi:CubicO group peptidase (beta-lactamase class C family)
MSRPLVHGAFDPRFARVREAFAEQLAAPGELGAAVCIHCDGRSVVDLWGGWADAARTRPWERDTVATVFSSTKGLLALCAHRLADEGLLDFDAPVARYWPEFAQGGKAALPVGQLFDHSAGLAAVSKPLPSDALYDWDAMTAALAEQTPWWTPGTRHGYHALTFGWLVGELVRRVSGQTPRVYLRETLAGPLGADVQIGLAASDAPRAAEIVPAPLPQPGEPNMMAEMLKNPTGVAARAFLNPLMSPNAVNEEPWRRAEIPAANGFASARGLACIYGAAACGSQDGVRVLSPEGQRRAGAERRAGPDLVLMEMFSRYGLGFMLGTEAEPLGPNPLPFGHSGAGGSLGFADPAARLGFGYVMNKMQSGAYLIGPRASALVAAAYACL